MGACFTRIAWRWCRWTAVVVYVITISPLHCTQHAIIPLLLFKLPQHALFFFAVFAAVNCCQFVVFVCGAYVSDEWLTLNWLFSSQLRFLFCASHWNGASNIKKAENIFNCRATSSECAMPTERCSTFHSIILWMFIIGPILLYLVFSRMCFDPKSSKNGIYPMRDECRLICEFCTYFLFQSPHIHLYLYDMHATLPTPYIWALAREPIPNRGGYVVGSPIWAIFHEVITEGSTHFRATPLRVDMNEASDIFCTQLRSCIRTHALCNNWTVFLHSSY